MLRLDWINGYDININRRQFDSMASKQNNNSRLFIVEYDLKSMAVFQNYSTRLKIISCGVGFKMNQQTVGHPVTVSAPLHQSMKLAWQVGTEACMA